MRPGETVKFTVPGRPVPAVRMTQRSKYSDRARRYLAYKSVVGWSAKIAKLQPVNGPIAIEAVFYFGNKRLPDVDNLLKAVMDGLNKVAWCDDRQIVRSLGERRQGEPERAEITITYLVEDRSSA